MYETKVNLSILLPGRTMLSEQEVTVIKSKPLLSPKTGKQLYRNGKPVFRTHKEYDYDKMEKILVDVGGQKSEIIPVHVRKCKTAKQILNICKEAYEDMIKAEKPYDYKSSTPWAVLSKDRRLEWHLQQIAKSLGGTLESFSVYED